MCACVCIYIHIYTYTHTHTHTYTHAHTHAHTLQLAHTHAHALRLALTLTHMYTHTHAYTYTYTYTYTYMHMHAYAYTYTCVHTHTHTHTHTRARARARARARTCTHTHTCIHARIYTCKYTSGKHTYTTEREIYIYISMYTFAGIRLCFCTYCRYAYIFTHACMQWFSRITGNLVCIFCMTVGQRHGEASVMSNAMPLYSSHVCLRTPTQTPGGIQKVDPP